MFLVPSGTLGVLSRDSGSGSIHDANLALNLDSNQTWSQSLQVWFPARDREPELVGQNFCRLLLVLSDRSRIITNSSGRSAERDGCRDDRRTQ